VLPLCVTYHLDVSMYVWFPVFAYLGTFMCVFCCSMLHLVVSSILVDAPKRCARAPTLIVHGPFTIHTRRLRRIKVQGSFLMTYAAMSEFPYCIPFCILNVVLIIQSHYWYSVLSTSVLLYWCTEHCVLYCLCYSCYCYILSTDSGTHLNARSVAAVY